MSEKHEQIEIEPEKFYKLNNGDHIVCVYKIDEDNPSSCYHGLFLCKRLRDCQFFNLDRYGNGIPNAYVKEESDDPWIDRLWFCIGCKQNKITEHFKKLKIFGGKPSYYCNSCSPGCGGEICGGKLFCKCK